MLRSLITQGTEDPIFQEQFKALRAKFEYRAEMLKYRVVAVTSSIAGEGKTLSCVNLATNLASSGTKRVLLVDMDLRKLDLSRGLELPVEPGLTEFLSGTVQLEKVIRNSRTSGLYVLPGGTRIAAPMDQLTGNRFRDLLLLVRKHYDVVLLDTPPILPVADTLSLKNKVDGFVFIFRIGFTPYPMLKQALDEIGEKNVMGVVLNGVEPHKQKYYQKYYGKYYGKA